MEYEMVPDAPARPRARVIDPAVEAAAPEVSGPDANAVRPGIGAPAAPFHPSAVIGLQRTAGNAAVSAMLQRSLVTAEGPDTDGDEETSPVLDIVGKGRGQPLDKDLRAEMESQLGSDFSDVRVHTDADAAKSAKAVAARAYTVGNDVVLGADAPALDSAQGKRTLAHELTHVLQQRRGPVDGTPTGGGISISDPSDRFEQAAEAAATRVMSDLDAGSPMLPSHGDASASAQAQAQLEATDEEPDELAQEEPASEEPASEEPAEEKAVQGIWVQRVPVGTDTQGEGEEDQAFYEAEAEREEQETENQELATDLEIQEEQPENAAEGAEAELEEEEEAVGQANEQAEEEQEAQEEAEEFA
jgi:hypothetical protein